MNLATSIAPHVAAATPPFLLPAFETLQFIWGSIQRLKTNRHQMRAIAQAAAQILFALSGQDEAADVDAAARAGFERTLVQIRALCERMGRRRFVRAFLEAAEDQREITLVHAQLALCVDVLQVGAQVGMQEHARRAEEARRMDQEECSATLHELLEKQDELLELVGDAPVGGVGAGETPQTVFRLLEGILASLRAAGGGTGREEEFREVLAQLRKMTALAREDNNPILVLLRPGLTPDILVGPLKWRMYKLTQIERLAIHLTRELSEQFGAAEVGSQRFIDHLMRCDDRPLQYAALDVFQHDDALKHFFKQDFVFPRSNDPNPILAHLKPGMTPAALVPPLKFEVQKFAWKDIITQQLHSNQIASFFRSGPEGCERFIKYITEGDDLALQYAMLQVFREDKRVAHYFIREETSKAQE